LYSLSKASTKSRFKALDGLRALAVLGVLWMHTWTVHGNPRFIIGNFDITSIMALGGNGVDLFFVISGFCMYYFYAGNKQFSYTDFGAFLKKRWIRLSPAFYTVSVVYIAVKVATDPSYPFVKSLLTSLTYLNGTLPAYNPEGILWSLTPEWQFYLIVPFLLIYQNRYGFGKTFLIISIALLAVAVTAVVVLKSRSNMLSSQIILRYVEFMWGILVGKLLLSHPRINLKYRPIWLVGFIIVIYTGRLLLSKPIQTLSSDYFNLLKLAAYTEMGLGFSGVIYLALTSQKWLRLMLGNPVLSFIGKISFSFYLWHGLVHRPVADRVMIAFPKLSGITLPVISFCISVLLLLPLAAASYYLLEHNFMARNKQWKTTSPSSLKTE
jgi:peptidoglycan/LPS O-acetylase OafA/YrhL